MIIVTKRGETREDQPQEILSNVWLIAYKRKLQQKTMKSRGKATSKIGCSKNG